MTKHEVKQERPRFAIPMLPEIGTIPTMLTKSAEAYQQAIMDWQKEISTFVADRIQQDTEALQALAEEHTFPALLKVQQDWFSAAMQDYTREGQKLMQIAGRLAGAGLMPQMRKAVGHTDA